MTQALSRPDFQRWVEQQPRVDAGGKLADHFRVPSIQHYLLMRPQRRR